MIHPSLAVRGWACRPFSTSSNELKQKTERRLLSFLEAPCHFSQQEQQVLGPVASGMCRPYQMIPASASRRTSPSHLVIPCPVRHHLLQDLTFATMMSPKSISTRAGIAFTRLALWFGAFEALSGGLLRGFLVGRSELPARGAAQLSGGRHSRERANARMRSLPSGGVARGDCGG